MFTKEVLSNYIGKDLVVTVAGNRNTMCISGITPDGLLSAYHKGIGEKTTIWEYVIPIGNIDCIEILTQN